MARLTFTGAEGSSHEQLSDDVALVAPALGGDSTAEREGEELAVIAEAPEWSILRVAHRGLVPETDFEPPVFDTARGHLAGFALGAVVVSGLVLARRAGMEESTGSRALDYIEEHGLEAAVERCRRLAETVFGGETRLETSLRTDLETGENELVLSVQYPGGRAFEELQELDREFYDRYVRTVDGDHRAKISVLARPTDAD